MKSVTKFFEEKLNAPLANQLWSWGSENENGIYMSVWADQCKKVDDQFYVMVLPNESNSVGAEERKRHIGTALNGKQAYGVVRVAKDNNAKVRQTKSFNDEWLLKFNGKMLADDNGIWFAYTDKISI